MPSNPLPPAPAGSNEIEIDRGRIRQLAALLPAAARPLDEVVPCLAGLAVAEAAFTSFTYSLALAYNEAEAFTIAEARRLGDDVERIRDTVTLSAVAWQHAEDAGTPRIG
ncbi:hypothetical protein FXF51_08400 [Nonomuraea sp. PA05]|uniref:hypothetical protein n=1 Tax=Nonomuraea sp. PA05 TaxID=2604466 RepID=UPI0011DBDFBF|nr:hypothetical protein [Nonomuraea sp. PA05]TYB69242.1 hypothetical protein FXF51_08400 [Nonomuraea sp. PA05]